MTAVRPSRFLGAAEMGRGDPEQAPARRLQRGEARSQAHVEPDITMEIFFVDGPLDGFGAVEISEPE